MDLLTNYTPHSELQVITAPPLISTVHKSPQHPLSLYQPAVSSPTVPCQRLLTVEILQFHAHRFYLHSLPCRAQLNWLPSQSQSHIATDGQSVSLGVKPHPGPMTRYLLLFDSYGLVVEASLPLVYCCMRVCCRRYLATAAVNNILA
jgi:hypothetical protein